MRTTERPYCLLSVSFLILGNKDRMKVFKVESMMCIRLSELRMFTQEMLSLWREPSGTHTAITLKIAFSIL